MNPAFGQPHVNAPFQPVMMPTTGASDNLMDQFDPAGKYRIKKQGAYAAVEISVTDTDTVLTEGGAMISMHAAVDLDITFMGGMGASLLRCCCAGESFFMSEFKAGPEATPGQAYDVLVAPGIPGEVLLLHLDGQVSWRIQKGSFLACDPSIRVNTAMQSFTQGCCSGEGLFVLEAEGMGRLVVNSFGSMIRYDLGPGEKRIVDNGALVAWTGHTEYTISRANKNNTMASIFSGEGLVCKFTGPGTIFIQSRSLQALAKAIVPYLPTQNAGGGGDGGGFGDD